MRIAVLGSTGATGRQVLQVALRRGHEVVALARRPEALAGAGVEVVPADVRKAGEVAAALLGADAVISCLGALRSGPPDTLSSGAHEIAAAHELAAHEVAAHHKAARERAVNGKTAPGLRVAWQGSFGAGASRHRAGVLYDPVLRMVLGETFDDKARSEEIVGRVGATIFHPVQLTAGPATGAARVVPLDELDRRFRLMPSRVSRADVAVAMVIEVENPAYSGRTVAVY
jgi:uncharacterized protein